MPNAVRSGTPAGKIYARPFRGPTDYFDQIAVNIAVLTDFEVDDYGYLKPGVPFTKAGILAGAGTVVHMVIPEPIQVLNLMPFGFVTKAAALAAAGVVQLGGVTQGQVNRAIIEANLGRVLTANELAAFAAAGCLIKLL